MNRISISTITPVYRGADTLKSLAKEINKYRESLIAFSGSLQLVESIFVDDGSSEGSSEILEQLQNEFFMDSCYIAVSNFWTTSGT